MRTLKWGYLYWRICQFLEIIRRLSSLLILKNLWKLFLRAPYPNAYFCSFSYDQLTYNYEIYEYNGTCNNEILDLSGPTPYYINACNATGLFNLTQLDIQYQTNRCGTYVLQNKQQSILSVENSGCFILDSTVIGDVSTPTTETCESCWIYISLYCDK